MIRLRPLPAIVAGSMMVTLVAFASEAGRYGRQMGINEGQREVSHVLVFALLAALALWSLKGRLWICTLVAGLVCFAFALADEWHQGFVAWRSSSYSDVGLDLLGIAIGLIAVSLLRAGLFRRDLNSGGESP